MAWNEPGGSKDRDPWGGRNKNQGPPDLDEVVRKIQAKLRALFGGKRAAGGGPTPEGGRGGGANPSGIGLVILLALGGWLLYDSVHIIQAGERGVVTRFGQYVSTLDPGLSLRLPRPFERVERVNVEGIRNVEIGFRSGAGGAKAAAVTGESLMLTRDENIIDVRLSIQYRVKSASDYLFSIRDPDQALREASESAVREVVGKNTMDFVLTEGRSEIVARVQKLIQEVLDRYKTGLMVTSVNMQDAQPPAEVQHAFDDAVKAREDEQRQINEAEAYSNDILPKARGAAARMIEEANAYKSQVVAQAEGEANRFNRILTEYKKAPGVTRQRMYIETIEQVLGQTTKIMVAVNKGNNVLYLPLDKMIESGALMRGQVPAYAPVMPAAPVAAPEVEAKPAAKSAADAARDVDALRSREAR